jgi:hypothetical protein
MAQFIINSKRQGSKRMIKPRVKRRKEKPDLLQVQDPDHWSEGNRFIIPAKETG